MSSSINETIARLLALRSGNRCAFPGCTETLSVDATELDGAAILGEMAHIAGEKPGSARYDPSMTDGQRNGLGNLIYLCRSHHRQVDRQPHAHSVETLSKWKADHEKRVSDALIGALADVGFAELEVVTKAIVSASARNDPDFAVLSPAAKMQRNDMTDASYFILSMGLSKAREVRAFVQYMAVYDDRFPDQLRAGFQKRYEMLKAEGLRGDNLFQALCDFASSHSVDQKYRAASLAVVAYLFEACDVFEK